MNSTARYRMTYSRLHGKPGARKRGSLSGPAHHPSRGGRDQSGAGLLVSLGLIAVLLLALVKAQAMPPPGRGVPAEPASEAVDTAALADEVSTVLEAADGTYGVYFKMLDTGEAVGLHSEEAFFAASCYKLPLVLMLYEMAAAGEIDLDEQIEYRPEDRELGTGVIVGYRYGSRFSLRELARLAVVKSDNVAGNMLLRRLGKDRFVEYQERCGVKVLPVKENLSSPADLGMLAERLWRFGTSTGALGSELLGYFIDSEHKDRIAAGLPAGTKVANKIGTWPGSVNDVGIVCGDEITYVLVVMSRGVPSEESGCRIIAAISSRIHRFLEADIRSGAG